MEQFIDHSLCNVYLVTYSWEITEDYAEECPSECGLEESTQSRTVICKGSDDSTSETECDESNKPATSRICAATAICSNQFFDKYNFSN